MLKVIKNQFTYLLHLCLTEFTLSYLSLIDRKLLPSVHNLQNPIFTRNHLLEFPYVSVLTQEMSVCSKTGTACG